MVVRPAAEGPRRRPARMDLTVDLHQHVIPDFYWEASNEDGNAAGGITPPRWSLDGAIAYLDEAGVDVAVPSARQVCTSVTMRRHGRSRVASTTTWRSSSASAPTGSADSPRFRYRMSTGRWNRSSTPST